ncbi:DUF2946 family protein [Candidatus Kirkpatrickella diaphorinae]|uniref:DUF2946 family protein n=1 Tax=Candidatus Kirkpatrickella diaphorinae TaxID=2984322 RepID=A0ABY6GKC4_9PROT|nr:DUF2946 family protein [Candidatus Kirkpatrickella diaphorinae]UYH51993.1 DUF2946 family protein [Candidatus Kirkpatrickella diaphorinae]
MQRSVRAATRLKLRHLCLALLILLGFTGELTLQSLATPDEVPRAEIVRLLGIDIAPGVSSAASAGMHHHHHKHKPGHVHQGCVLCPLLTLAAMMVAQAVIFPLSSQPVLRLHRVLFTARAPPPIFFPRPFGQGPPSPS